MIRVTTSLSVKELAHTLGRSPGYVYKMRMAGFEMRWDVFDRCFVTTELEARQWVEKNRFRVIKGRPSQD